MPLLVTDQERIRRQFDYLCKLVLRGERCTYIKQVLRRAEKEIPFSDVSEIELNRLYTMDESSIENVHFLAMGYPIEVEGESLAAAIAELTPIKREIVLLYFYMDMNCTAIAKLMGKDSSTVSHHRRSALVLLKKSMEARRRL